MAGAGPGRGSARLPDACFLPAPGRLNFAPCGRGQSWAGSAHHHTRGQRSQLGAATLSSCLTDSVRSPGLDRPVVAQTVRPDIRGLPNPVGRGRSLTCPCAPSTRLLSSLGTHTSLPALVCTCAYGLTCSRGPHTNSPTPHGTHMNQLALYMVHTRPHLSKIHIRTRLLSLLCTCKHEPACSSHVYTHKPTCAHGHTRTHLLSRSTHPICTPTRSRVHTRVHLICLHEPASFHVHTRNRLLSSCVGAQWTLCSPGNLPARARTRSTSSSALTVPTNPSALLTRAHTHTHEPADSPKAHG